MRRYLFNTICRNKRMATGLLLFAVVMLRRCSLMMMATLVVSMLSALRCNLPALLKAAFGRAFGGSKHTNRAQKGNNPISDGKHAFSGYHRHAPECSRSKDHTLGSSKPEWFEHCPVAMRVVTWPAPE